MLDGAVKIPKLSPMEARIHREIIGKVKSITLSRTSTGKYFASILCEDAKGAPEKPDVIDADKITGCDLGLTHFLIRSDGRKQANPRYLIRASQNLRRKQKALSRKVKSSKNRTKARLIVARCHEKVGNSRADFQHKLSRALIDENQAVIVETLKTSNMLKNQRLARHINDAGWQGFVTKLEYKAIDAGKHLVKLDQWYASSKKCHRCGHKEIAMPLGKRFWQCPACQMEHDRDINAALNIKQQGCI
ncbi:transposase [Candidatus Regiella insecticola LSR1]|uniref:Transposase n=1 Tax=Candidatus Regiella insecticola LSR1 TaxID=663321 RepID=E0WSY1_9ENTR|nr:transposase [Candidatus Regiella insecticola LSR1]